MSLYFDDMWKYLWAVRSVLGIVNINWFGFAIKFVAVGCPSIPPPVDGWVKQTGHNAYIGCDNLPTTWKLYCNGTSWVGERGNCTVTGNFQAYMKSRVLVTLVKCCNDIENLELKQDIRPTEIILVIFGVQLYTILPWNRKQKIIVFFILNISSEFQRNHMILNSIVFDAPFIRHYKYKARKSNYFKEIQFWSALLPILISQHILKFLRQKHFSF